MRKWSIGSIEGKTFQQMTVEFEEAVIPKVWELEERKILRAAKKLSISPKKVRRILHRLGLESH
jgi:transposase